MYTFGFTKSALRQYYAALTCNFSTLMTGIGFVWLTPIMIPMLGPNSEIPMDYDEMSWIVAIVEIGELITPLPAGLLLNKVGSKPLILSTGFLMLIAWTLAALTRSILVLYIVRLLIGSAIGIVLTVVPIYVAEICEPQLRGRLCGHLNTMYMLGILYSYCTGPYLSYQNYIYVCALPCFIFIMTFVFAPESPYYLMMVHREEEAQRSLEWLRASTNVKKELEVIKLSIEFDKSGSDGQWRALFGNKESRRALLIVCTVAFVRFFGGTSTVINYSTKTMTDSMNNMIDPNIVTIFLAVVLLITTWCSASLSDRVGRKPLVIFSSLGLGLISAFICVYYFLERESDVETGGYEYVLYGCLAAYCLASNIGLGPVMPALQAEYFTSKTRGPAGAVVTSLSTTLVFISLKQYQIVETYIGVYANYLIFSVSIIGGLILLLSCMVETANKPLASVQNT